ncbi:MAG: hypothetical protein HQM12_12000 [SAR324 cluster bacterium]|nr:hypothetical protein [SAR324 cluster bacterium]
MRTDTLIKHLGFTALLTNLNLEEAERFIALIRRDHFNYTEWRKDLWEDQSIRELSRKAEAFSAAQKERLST